MNQGRLDNGSPVISSKFVSTMWRWLSHPVLCSYMCVHTKSLQLCLTLCDPMDCSLPGTFVHGILQVRILEWVAIPSSRVSSWPRDRNHVSINRQVLHHSHHLGSLLLHKFVLQRLSQGEGWSGGQRTFLPPCGMTLGKSGSHIGPQIQFSWVQFSSISDSGPIKGTGLTRALC